MPCFTVLIAYFTRKHDALATLVAPPEPRDQIPSTSRCAHPPHAHAHAHTTATAHAHTHTRTQDARNTDHQFTLGLWHGQYPYQDQ